MFCPSYQFQRPAYEVAVDYPDGMATGMLPGERVEINVLRSQFIE